MDKNINIQKIGESDKNRDIYIVQKNRCLNSIFLGISGTGKTSKVLPMLILQDLENKDCGGTIVVNNEEIAYTLQAIAKKMRRKVYMISVYENRNVEDFIKMNKYNHEYIEDNIIDFKKVIREKAFVIINIDIDRYKSLGKNAVGKLLYKFQFDMQRIDITEKRNHYLYIDDSQYYLPYIEPLLRMGKNYNVGTTLFIQSRNQLIQKVDYSDIIDCNVRSTFLLNNLTFKDIQYYNQVFYEYNINLFFNRQYLTIIYETIDDSNKRRNGVGSLDRIPDDIWDEYSKKANKLLKKSFKNYMKGEFMSNNTKDSPLIKPKNNIPIINSNKKLNIQEIYKKEFDRTNKKFEVLELDFEENDYF